MPDDPPKQPTLPVDVQLAIYGAVQDIDEKLGVLAANIRERNDDVLAMKQRQNRHGGKIRRLEGAVFGGARPPALSPAWMPQGPIRPPAPSRPDWDPEDTHPHLLAPADMVRLGELAERDRKDSNFWRELPRAAFLKGVGMVAALVLTAAFTWLITRH